MIEGDSVCVSVTVRAPADVAFDVFTGDIDQWWKRGRKYRVAGREPGTLVLEPRAQGRVFESYAEGTAVHEVGRVTVWEPPSRLVFEWRAVNFAPGEITEVEVRFTALDDERTQVELVHRGFAALRPDHPVRHGEPARAFLRTLGMWWGDLMGGYRERANDRRT